MTDQIPTPDARRPEPLSILWRVFTAPQTMMVLMGLIALSLVLSTLIPQIPPEARQDPQAWLSTQEGLLGQNRGAAAALGLFDVLHSFWFRLLLVLAGLALLVWIVESAEVAWRATGAGRWTPDALASWAGNAPSSRVSSSLPPEGVIAHLHDLLLQHGFQLAGIPEFPDTDLVVSRRGLLLWIRPAFYSALLLALVGLVIVETWGWQNRDWQPAPGESRLVGHDSPFALRLEEFGLPPDDGGRPCDYQSRVSFLEDATVVQEVTFTTGQPARFRGIAVRQVGYLPAVQIRGRDEVGRPLLLQEAGDDSGVPGAVEIVFPAPEAQPLLFVASHDLYLALSFTARAEDDEPELRVDLLGNDGTGRRTLQVLRESRAVEFDGSQLEVDLTFRPILRVDYRPGSRLVLLGMVLAAVTGLVLYILPVCLAWFRVEPRTGDTTSVRIVAPVGAGCRHRLLRLVQQVRGVLTDDD
jgi:hypothetical protein